LKPDSSIITKSSSFIKRGCAVVPTYAYSTVIAVVAHVDEFDIGGSTSMEVLGGSTARLHAGREITRLDNISLLSSETIVID